MQNEQRFSGLWHNQFGSEINLEVTATGKVSGKFRTNVGRQETKLHWQNSWYDVVGFINGDLISFVVKFEIIGSLTAVSGCYVSKDKSTTGMQRIETAAYTSFNLPEADQWRHRVATFAVYEPGPSPSGKMF